MVDPRSSSSDMDGVMEGSETMKDDRLFQRTVTRTPATEVESADIELNAETMVGDGGQEDALVDSLRNFMCLISEGRISFE